MEFAQLVFIECHCVSLPDFELGFEKVSGSTQLVLAGNAVAVQKAIGFFDVVRQHFDEIPLVRRGRGEALGSQRIKLVLVIELLERVFEVGDVLPP